MDDQRAQIVEKIKASNNFLVTVSTNPSVDQLAAAIGLTLILGKLNKQATAVFSGEVPSTIRFLRPEKTLQKNPDNLQDFIISLDKAKADKLRYKVEDDVVRIFITPYKTSLSSKDLTYSKGDFNVDVVLALGVSRKDDIDSAIAAHGRILHDATVISITTTERSQLGTLHLEDTSVSGVSELVTALVRDLGNDLLDDRIATALLTGLVAATDHFGNDKTTPTSLTASANLLEAGANQQLVSVELEHKDGGGKHGQNNAQQLKSYKQLAREQGKDKPADSTSTPQALNNSTPTKELPSPVNPEVQDASKQDDAPALVAPEPAAPITFTPPAPAAPAASPSPEPDNLPKHSSVIEMPPAKPDESVADQLATDTPTPTPMIDTNKTLADIETEVDSPHAKEASTDVDSARQAVENALGASSGNPPADMGTQDSGLGLDAHVPETPASEAPATPAAPAPVTDIPDFLKTPSMETAQPAAPAAPLTPPPVAPPVPPTPVVDAPAAPPIAPPLGGPQAAPASPLSEPPVPPAAPLNPAANEQAPLSNSPADQPFTMPLPPTPAGPAVIESDELPPALQGSSPAGPPPGPPPIPPSMPPPGPGISRY